VQDAVPLSVFSFKELSIFNVDNCSGQRVHSTVSLVGQGYQSVQHIGANGCSFQFRTEEEMSKEKRRKKEKSDSK
jgi:hypothetical protein